MGLFDTFCEIAKATSGAVKDYVNQTASTIAPKSTAEETNNAPENNPFIDPVVTQYFDVLCTLQRRMDNETFAPEDQPLAKRYVEYCLKCECNEEKLQDAMNLCNLGSQEKRDTKYEQDLTFRWRKSTDATDKYMDYLDYVMTFRPDIITRTAEKIDYVLDVIKDNVNCRHFAQGINNIKENYKLKELLLTERFLAGNPVMQEYVFKYFTEELFKDYKGKNSADLFYSCSRMAIIAAHFEKYGDDPDNYPPVSEKEYRDFVSVVPECKKIIDDNPFEKEKWIDKLAMAVRNAALLAAPGSNHTYKGYTGLTFTDGYTYHAAYHFVSKKISNIKKWISEGSDVSGTMDATILYKLLYTYFN